MHLSYNYVSTCVKHYGRCNKIKCHNAHASYRVNEYIYIYPHTVVFANDVEFKRVHNMKKNVLETMFIDNLFEKKNEKKTNFIQYIYTYYYNIVYIGKRNITIK